MLNGKFFTGLPPKMIDRGGAAANRNRLESHFFWPDDTKVETAVECRIKRRNSVLEKGNEKPLYEKQISVADNEVDTKKRFSKEFSQSSIQFYDNLIDNRTRKPVLRSSIACKKMEIAEKPTNTKLELPDSVIDEAYTTAKKQQAYTSKIEFNDYVNDSRDEFQNSRNNLRKPKMDMNDKREMELNSKNSPKLQVKRNVRSLSEENEERKINNREVQSDKKFMKDNYIQRERVRILNNEDFYLQGRQSVEPRMNKSPQRKLVKPRNNCRESFSSETEILREPEYLSHDDGIRRKLADYEYAEDNLDSERVSRRVRTEPKRILRNSSRGFFKPLDDRDYYEAEQEIQNKMKTVHLKSPTRKQYYPPEEYYNDEPDNYYDESEQTRTHTKRGNNHRNNTYNDREYNEVDLPYKNSNAFERFNKQSRTDTAINRINNNIENQVVTSATSSIPEDELQNAVKPRKHLRSSLCFNDGAIVADNSNNDNDGIRSPTSSQYSKQRRNARSSATQRVSVGLPD